MKAEIGDSTMLVHEFSTTEGPIIGFKGSSSGWLGACDGAIGT